MSNYFNSNRDHVPSQRNLRVSRNKFKKKLIGWGMPLDEVDLCVQQYEERQRLKILKVIPKDAPLCTRASYISYLKKTPGGKSSPHVRFGEDYEPPSDSGYKPTNHDSTLTGVGRATGKTAKAIKRKKTITKFEYDNED